jgi:hypothetical protein
VARAVRSRLRASAVPQCAVREPGNIIGPDGRERYFATPMADHTKSGTAYLPPGQITAWGQGIAQVAETLAP